MRLNVKLLLVVLLLPLLVGCLRFSLETLRRTDAVGSEFTRALTVEYQSFSQSEADQYDWWNAEKFARKGLKTANGEEVAPEDPNEWDIPETELPALLDAREKLLGILTPEIKKEEPELSARAQALYDCWIEQQEENWQTEHIAACRNEFFDIIDYFTTPKDAAVNVNPTNFEEVVPEKAGTTPSWQDPDAKPAEPKKAAAAVSEKPAFMKTDASYVIFFDFNSTKLTKEGLKILDQVVESVKNERNYEIALNGYADTVGNAEYNLVLSRRRAAVVRSALVKKGLLKESIVLYSFGEDKLAVKTKDGVKEKANRRVEVFIH